MRHESEIARAHDLLGNLLNGNVPSDLPDSTWQVMKITHMALCWSLEHDEQDARLLDRLLVDLSQECRDCGYRLPYQNPPHSN